MEKKKILYEIRNLGNVEMILLNVIYFKSNWKYKFNKIKISNQCVKNLNQL